MSFLFLFLLTYSSHGRTVGFGVPTKRDSGFIRHRVAVWKGATLGKLFQSRPRTPQVLAIVYETWEGIVVKPKSLRQVRQEEAGEGGLELVRLRGEILDDFLSPESRGILGAGYCA